MQRMHPRRQVHGRLLRAAQPEMQEGMDQDVHPCAREPAVALFLDDEHREEARQNLA